MAGIGGSKIQKSGGDKMDKFEESVSQVCSVYHTYIPKNAICNISSMLLPISVH